MNTFERSETGEICGALARLAQEKGVRVTHDDVVVKQATAQSGKRVYVVVALGAIERVIGNVLASVMRRLRSGPIAIWALRQDEVDQLLRNARALS